MCVYIIHVGIYPSLFCFSFSGIKGDESRLVNIVDPRKVLTYVIIHIYACVYTHAPYICIHTRTYTRVDPYTYRYRDERKQS